MKNRIALARKQRVHAQSGLVGKFPEAAAINLVSDEYVPETSLLTVNDLERRIAELNRLLSESA